MKKRLILIAVLASVITGGLSAFAVSSIVDNKRDGDATAYFEPAASPADVHFTQSAGGTSGLPDLTRAAQMGVEAVVNIETIQKIEVSSAEGGVIDPFEFFFGPGRGRGGQQAPQREQERRGGGSGVIISADGYIVTNNHVIDGASEVRVTLNSGDSFKAKVVGADPSTDIALIKVEAADTLSFLQFGNSEKLLLGQWVLAIGNPYGLNSTVTAGIVSAKGRSLGVIPNSQMGIESFIQTDAAVNPGNSGGALVSTDGELMGINTLIKSPTGAYTGYSFAVPSNIARKVVGDIRQYGMVQRALLGVAMQEITDEWIEQMGEQTGIKTREGVYVAEVSPDGAAAAVGIKKGDVIVQINDTKITSPSVVQEIIARYRPGDKVKIAIKRSGEVKPFEVTLRNRSGREELMSRTDVDMLKELGAELRPVSDKTKKELKIRGGLQVISLNPNGVLAKARVKVGYIITAINEQSVNGVEDLNRITDKLTSIEGIYPDGRMVSYQAL